jgi:hypothetical protein
VRPWQEWYTRACSYRLVRCPPSRSRSRQGLTLVHFSAAPKPFWSHLPVSPCLLDWGKMTTHQRIQQNVLTLSRNLDECKPLAAGRSASDHARLSDDEHELQRQRQHGTGSHSSTSRLNVSTRGSNDPRNTSVHHQLITCQYSAGAYTRPLLGSTLQTFGGIRWVWSV